MRAYEGSDFSSVYNVRGGDADLPVQPISLTTITKQDQEFNRAHKELRGDAFPDHITGHALVCNITTPTFVAFFGTLPVVASTATEKTKATKRVYTNQNLKGGRKFDRNNLKITA